MATLNKNAIKLAQMLELDVKKTEKLYNIIGLSDLAALTTAINNDDMSTIRSIFSKYQSQLNDLPSASEVQAFYADAQKTGSKDPLADTADHFGITGEDVEKLMAQTESVVKEVEEFIPDSYVKAAFENVKEMLKGGKNKRHITELNAWQRRMFYGLVPDVVSATCQKTLDMTPIELMQKQAEIAGVAEPSINEYEMGLHEMIENIIEHELNEMNGEGYDASTACPTCDGHGEVNKKDLDGNDESDMEDCEDCDGTGKKENKPLTEDEGCSTCHDKGKVSQEWRYGKLLVPCPDCKGEKKKELDEAGPQTKIENYKGKDWELRVVTEPHTDGYYGIARYMRKKNQIEDLTTTGQKTIEDAFRDLKNKVDEKLGTRAINTSRAMIDFNIALTKEIIGGHDMVYANIVNQNGKPVLLVSGKKLEGLYPAADRQASREGASGAHGFSMSRAAIDAAGLKHARYKLGAKTIYEKMPTVSAWELDIDSGVQPGEYKRIMKPALTVAAVGKEIGESALSLIKDITSKRF